MHNAKNYKEFAENLKIAQIHSRILFIIQEAAQYQIYYYNKSYFNSKAMDFQINKYHTCLTFKLNEKTPNIFYILALRQSF